MGTAFCFYLAAAVTTTAATSVIAAATTDKDYENDNPKTAVVTASVSKARHKGILLL